MALWRGETPLVLASKSNARRALLEAAGIPVQIIPADIDERAAEQKAPDRSPKGVAQFLAQEKAHSTASLHPGRLVLGADQVLALGERRFSKPVDRVGALAQLRDLRGKTHALHSGFALMRGHKMIASGCEAALLTMRDFSDAFLDDYLTMAGDAVTQSVGGYQLEGLGIHLFARIEGDHATILGLPLLPLLEALRRDGQMVA